jgi:hypothetical protein
MTVLLALGSTRARQHTCYTCLTASQVVGSQAPGQDSTWIAGATTQLPRCMLSTFLLCYCYFLTVFQTHLLMAPGCLG